MNDRIVEALKFNYRPLPEYDYSHIPKTKPTPAQFFWRELPGNLSLAFAGSAVTLGFINNNFWMLMTVFQVLSFVIHVSVSIKHK